MKTCLLSFLLASLILPAVYAADIFKANNANNLNLTASWLTNGIPAVPAAGDIAVWNSTVSSANASALGAGMAWSGIRVADPGGAVTIAATSGKTLTNGASGIDLSAATANLTINCALTLGSAQTWSVATNKSLAIGSVFGGNSALALNGPGTVSLTGQNNASYTGAITVSGVNLLAQGGNTSYGALGGISGLTINNAGTVTGAGANNGLFGNAPSTLPILVHTGGTLAAQAGLTIHTRGIITLNGGTLASVDAGYAPYGTWYFDQNSLYVTNFAPYGSVTSTITAQRMEFTGPGSVYVDNGCVLNVTGWWGDKDGSTATPLIKTGAGTMIMAGNNMYTGPTTISNGTMLVNGSLAAGSAVTVQPGTTLGGVGTVNGSLTVNGCIAPGPLVGTLSTGPQTWNGGGSFLCEINRTNSSSSDSLNITGNLNVQATPGNPFTIKLVSLASGNVPGLLTNFSPSTFYSWPIATTTGGFQNFATNAVALDTTAFSNNLAGGSFLLAVQGNSLLLDFLPANYALPPAVALTAPTNFASYTAPLNLNLWAAVVTNGNTINKVQFFNNGTTLLGETAFSPYTLAWTNVPPGNYSLTASVVFNATNAAVSSPVNVVVLGTPPPAPMAPAVYGSRPGTPFLLYLAAAGLGTNRTWTATGLPSGLSLNPTNGLITGTTPAAGQCDVAWTASGGTATVSNTLHLVFGANLCLTPPIGWNSWNGFQGNVTETNLQQIADAIIHAGLMDYGFAFVNLDDQWAQSARVSVTTSNGTQSQLLGNTNRFPSGMTALANYLHQRGLKFGIYSDAAAQTCAGTQPGSYGYETVDANTFAQWGVDFLKYDYCGAPGDPSSAAARYTTMGNALAASGRSMVFNICEWGQRQPWLWAAQAGGHLWRTTFDMRDNWQYQTSPYRSQGAIGVLDALDLASGLESYQQPGAWNDPDMLMCGVDLAGSAGDLGATGLNPAQEQTMFSLWALMSAPMIFNADLRKLDPQSPYYNQAWAASIMGILTNTEVWAVNQDRLGRQAARIYRNGDVDLWRKNLWDGSVVLGLINRGGNAQTASISPTNAVPAGALLAVRDLWRHQDLGVLTNNTPFGLAAYETRLLRLRPAAINIRMASPNTVHLEFDPGAVLQTSTNLQQWQDSNTSTTNLDVPVAATNCFWRLRSP